MYSSDSSFYCRLYQRKPVFSGVALGGKVCERWLWFLPEKGQSSLTSGLMGPSWLDAPYSYLQLLSTFGALVMKIAGAPFPEVVGTGEGDVLIDMGTQRYKGNKSDWVLFDKHIKVPQLQNFIVPNKVMSMIIHHLAEFSCPQLLRWTYQMQPETGCHLWPKQGVFILSLGQGIFR